MTWMILNQRELEALEYAIGEADTRDHADLLRKIQARIVGEELELNDAEMAQVRKAAANWRGGFEKQFKAILTAAERHP